ncbi:ATP-binding protein [Streptomyces sp. NPDC050619]|uniref:ATP-binding protein n=1 Tax=Streptomyces sp. NPDC050619 TaxID=3157214 RepID=UPI0034232A9C
MGKVVTTFESATRHTPVRPQCSRPTREGSRAKAVCGTPPHHVPPTRKIPHGLRRTHQTPAALDRLRTPNSTSSPKICRDTVALLLKATGHPELVETARLLVSEIVTNVSLHTTSLAVRLEAVIRHDRVLVSVYDDDPGADPCPRVTDGQSENGRGLLLLAGFAHDWGVTWTDGIPTSGKRVWFELCTGRVGRAERGAGAGRGAS